MTHLNREQIADELAPYRNGFRERLLILLKERDQVVWESACKAQREAIELEFNAQGLLFPRFRHFPYAPFKMEGE